MFAVVPRGAPPVQASDRTVQSADAEADSRLSGGRHDSREKDDGDYQSEIQQPQHQVCHDYSFISVILVSWKIVK